LNEAVSIYSIGINAIELQRLYSAPPFAMTLLTGFGDLAVLLPLAAVMLLWLLVGRQRVGASGWILAVALCCAVTAAMKIYFSSCAFSPELQSPSGHTSFSVLVYGGIALVIAGQAAGWYRLMVLAATAALIGGIAISRIVLGAHTPLEVVFGMAIGATAVAIFARHYLSQRPAPLALRPLLIVLVLVAVLFHGHQLHAEEMLQVIGRYLRFGGIGCA
jgi:membrane-associated phospholipid phosphatase